MKELDQFTVERLKDLINQYEHEEYNDVSDEEVIALVAIALDAKRTNPLVVPEGWKLVPKQATLAMLTLIGFTGSFDSMQYRYIKMLAASPIYPVEGGE
ncbi:hypothetical protein [Yersinia frederiksenii]|uniref:hypothetical protein n=1 Tax=Yersinia frederiksenii TaxID=29484 RepID=UPI0011A024D3|nr:hypothetical protein [Yersinia frederiksenii]